jgi:lipopolysaccharide biosynthesis protein
VAKARPLFHGHYQPHLPADLGFYDLRLPETRQAQADLAGQYGVECFCYWHYWFHGKRLLERPFNEVLSSGQPAFPFCLAWANEPWSRRWLGEERDVLQDQTYSPEDDRNHIRWLMQAFADPRHIQVGGRPLFLIYRPCDLPEPNRTTDVFRAECSRNGLPEPCLLGINGHHPDVDYRDLGFDGTLDFQPELGSLPNCLHDGISLSKLQRNICSGVASATLRVYDYPTARRLMTKRRDFPVYPSIVVGWDNTPRRGRNGIILINSPPEAFESGLSALVRAQAGKPYDDRLVFINAWNEWAEGNYLEPDLKNGRRYLEAVRRANCEWRQHVACLS